MTRITVILRDNYPGYHEPLIYAVDVVNPNDENEVTAAVRQERARDLGEPEDGTENDLDLDIMFAFAGDIPTIADWRTG